jgi:hypothetical protein
VHTIIKLNLKGEEHFFHFNNYAQVELMKWTNKNDDLTEAAISLNEIIEQNFLLGMSVIIYCGLIGYQYSKFNIKHGYTLENISETIGNVDLNEWAPVWDAYKDATGMSQFIHEQAERNSKKVASESETTPTTTKKKSHSKTKPNLQSVK